MATPARRFEPDLVIEAYKRDADRTLLRENLKMTFQQRIERLADMSRFSQELQRAVKQATPVAQADH